MLRTTIMRSASARALVIAAGLSVAAIGAQAHAQSKAATPAPQDAAKVDDTDLGGLVVTGSFLHSALEDTAIPVSIITSKDLENRGNPTPVELLKNLNVVAGVVAGEANRYNTFPVNVATVNLRGIGANRTVVLFNGRRFPTQFGSATGFTANINQIPGAAIGQIQTITEGGATTYGADAVGGVQNYITRHGYDGVEAKGDYRMIDGAKGNYSASILFGKPFKNIDFLLSAEYSIKHALDADERDWADRPYLENNFAATWSASSNPGSFIFDTSTAPGNTITPTGVGLNQYAGNAQIGPTGIIRDQACVRLGGFAGYNTTASPVCYFHVDGFDRLQEQVSTFNSYAEFNAQLTPKVKYHAEFGLYLDHVRAATQPSDEPFGTGGFPVTCTSVTACATQPYYTVPGTNPAVGNFLSTFQNADGTTAYTAAQIAAITTTGQVRLSGTGGGPWRPFAQGGNPIRGRHDYQNIDTTQFRVVNTLTGELPTFLGTTLSYDAGLTYTHTGYNQSTEDMRGDRLQAALKGLGGPNCGATTPPVAGAGGCMYFNPFSSAVSSNLYTGQVNTGFVNNGTYTGYTAGQGLQNNNDLINWLYIPIWNKRAYDQFAADLVFSGDTGVKLPGGPIAVAFGGQYRYFRQDDRIDNFSNVAVTPCSNINPYLATPTFTGSCGAIASGDLVFGRNASVIGITRENTRSYPVYSGFGEVGLPILDNLDVKLSGRYEQFISDLTSNNNDVFVPGVSVRYEPIKWLAVRGFWGKTFSYVSPPANDPAVVAASQGLAVSGTDGPYGIGGPGASNFSSANYPNLGVKPETGTNYNVGLMFNVNSKLHASVDYFNVEIEDFARTLSVANIIQAVLVPGQTPGSGNLLNCASPLLQNQAGLGGNPFVQLIPGVTCVQGATTLANGLAGPSGSPQGRINYYGGTRQVNGGTYGTTGVDLSVDYTLENVFGGRLTLQTDITRVLTSQLSDFLVYGVKVANGYDGVGYLNASAGRLAGPVARLRGNVSLNWRFKNQNVNVTTRYISSVINDNAALFTETAALNANVAGAGGFVACPGVDANPSLTIPGASPAGAGTALYGSYCAALNYTNLLGKQLKGGFVNTDLSYRYEFDDKLAMSVSVFNLFDQDPEFSRGKFSYDTSTGSPLGRNFKVSLTKRF